MLEVFDRLSRKVSKCLGIAHAQLGNLVAIDGSLIDASLSMTWADYRESSNKAKVHLGIDLNRSIPLKLHLTDGKGSERPFVSHILETGQTGVVDRGYQSHERFDEWIDDKKHFVARLKNNTKWDVIDKLPFKWLQVIFLHFPSISCYSQSVNKSERRIHMIFAKVGDEGRKLLEEKLRTTKDAKWYRRLKIIQLSSLGETASKLSKTFDVCKATVRDYIKRYNVGGLKTLKRRNSNGRPPKIKLTKEQWEELLHRSPCQFEKLNTGARNWTQKLLSQYCHEYLGVQITPSAIGMLLKRMDMRWNRGKLKVTSPDPLYTVKRERVDMLKKKPNLGN